MLNDVDAGAAEQGPRSGDATAEAAGARWDVLQSRSLPNITVHSLDSTPPFPCARATSQSLTCRWPHSPRTCRTASIMTSRPYMPGWQ